MSVFSEDIDLNFHSFLNALIAVSCTASGSILIPGSTPLDRLVYGANQYQIPMTGPSPFSSMWTNLSALAGSGLSSASGIFSVNYADPSTLIGLAVVPGTALTAMRSDGAPALDQAISPTWLSNHRFNSYIGVNMAPTRQIDMQFDGTNLSTGIWSAYYGTGNTRIALERARGNIASPTAVALSDRMGAIRGDGYDGTNFVQAANILLDVDGTVSTGIVPGRIVLGTMDTSGALTERLRISSQGYVGIGTVGTSGPSNLLDVRYDQTTTPTGIGGIQTILGTGQGDNTTFIGLSGLYIQVKDRSATAGTRGVLYGLNIDVFPLVARSNSPYDDANGLVISNLASTALKATDALYVGHNSVFTSGASEWDTILTSAANAGKWLVSTGTHITGIDLSSATISGVALKFGSGMSISTSTGDITLGTGAGNGNIFLMPNGSGFVGIRATTTGVASGLNLPWISGDTLTTLNVGSSNASNNQIAVTGTSNSSVGVAGASTSGRALQGVSTSGPGLFAQSTSSVPITGVASSTQTNAVFDSVVSLRHNSSNTPLAGFGGRLKWQLKTSTTNDRDAASIDAVWSTATEAAQTSYMAFNLVNAGGALAEAMRLGVVAGSIQNGYVFYLGTTTPTIANVGTIFEAKATATGGTNAGFGSFDTGSPVSLRLNRSTSSFIIGHVGGANNYATGTVAGDAVFVIPQASSKLHMAPNNAIVGTFSSTGLGIGTISPSTPLHAKLSDAGTATVANVLTLDHATSGTPLASYGLGILMQMQDSTTTSVNASAINTLWTTATHNSNVSNLIFQLVNGSTTLTEFMRLTPVGLGVGLTPVANLHVLGSVNADSISAQGSTATTSPALTFRDSTGVIGSRIGMSQNSGAIAVGSVSGDLVYRTSTHKHQFSVDDGGSIGFTFDTTGFLGVGTASPATIFHGQLRNTQTNVAHDMLTLTHNSSNSVTAGFGLSIVHRLQDSANGGREAVRWRTYWNVATSGATVPYSVFAAWYNNTTEQDCIGFGANSTAALLGFYNISTAPIAQPANTVAIDDVLRNLGLWATGATTAPFAKPITVPAGDSASTVKPGGALFDHYADAGNVALTGETDLYSDFIAASTLGSNGDKLEATYAGIFVGNATVTREIRVYFAGTAIYDSGALTAAVGTDGWQVWVEMIRESSSIVRCAVSFVATGITNNTPVTYTKVTGLTLSNANTLKITGQTGVLGADNDIVVSLGVVEFIPAA